MNTRFASTLLLLIVIYNSDACNNVNVLNPGDYRNFWLELSSTTLCGNPGADPQGVCALAATCAVMGGVSQGTFNCPLTRGTCCRPVASCNATSIAINLLWQSPNYPQAQLGASNCQLRVVPSPDTCYIKIDFDKLDAESNDVDKCGKNKLRILGAEGGESNDLCGTLNHKTTYVKVARNMVGIRQAIDLQLTMEKQSHKYSVRVNHIGCSDVQTFTKDKYISAEARNTRVRQRESFTEPGYMARLFAVAYTDVPLIRSCPVTFISKDVVIGPASCGMRLGGPGDSKGLMVVHGASHSDDKSTYPASVSAMAKYVAANGVVVKKMVFHPLYNHVTKEHDIAVYFLNKTVMSAVPVDLSVTTESFLNLAVSISRYQYFRMADDVTVLAQAENQPTRVVKAEQCITSNEPKIAAISNNQTLCLAATHRENLPCNSRNGELGSPVIHMSNSGDITLIGLLMGNYHPCDGRKMDYPEPALKLSEYIDFINVATTPSYKIPQPDNSTIFQPVINMYNSVIGTITGS